MNTQTVREFTSRITKLQLVWLCVPVAMIGIWMCVFGVLLIANIILQYSQFLYALFVSGVFLNMEFLAVEGIRYAYLEVVYRPKLASREKLDAILFENLLREPNVDSEVDDKTEAREPGRMTLRSTGTLLTDGDESSSTTPQQARLSSATDWDTGTDDATGPVPLHVTDRVPEINFVLDAKIASLGLRDPSSAERTNLYQAAENALFPWYRR